MDDIVSFLKNTVQSHMTHITGQGTVGLAGNSQNIDSHLPAIRRAILSPQLLPSGKQTARLAHQSGHAAGRVWCDALQNACGAALVEAEEALVRKEAVQTESTSILILAGICMRYLPLQSGNVLSVG